MPQERWRRNRPRARVKKITMRGPASPKLTRLAPSLAAAFAVALLVLAGRGCVRSEEERGVERRPASAADRSRATPPAARPMTVFPLRTDAAPSTATTRLGASVPSTQPTSQPSAQLSDPIARIRDEGMNRSQVMQTASYLTDVIGPRLTGSPNLRRANEWTRQQFESWGLVNATLEPWGKFGRGWSLQRFSAQIVEPHSILLIGCPRAWSPGLEEPVVAEVVYLDGKTDADLEKYRGHLKGKIVMSGNVPAVEARFAPLAVRADDATLLQLANAPAGTAARPGEARGATASERRAAFASTPAGRALINRSATQPATNPTTTVPATTEATTQPGEASATSPTTAQTAPASQPSVLSGPMRTIAFLIEEGAAAFVSPSYQGDGGTLFVGAAFLPRVERDAPDTRPDTGPAASRRRPTPWDVDAPVTLPQVTLATEDFSRLVRMVRQGETPKMALDLRVQFHEEDLSAYNTVAEIPGTDLKDEIVMIGAHLDSWHAGTGATDNGAGVAATMEAMRILKALDLRPRRTVRIALWTGEEQGIYGSKAYVKEHFGYYSDDDADDSDAPERRPRRRGRPTTRPADPETASEPDSRPASRPATRPRGPLVKRAEYDRLSAYFNLDHGTGKIRGVYMEGNEAVRPLFRQWLAPFADLGAQTLSASRTGGTDHVPFDAVGLPAFQFIQDPIEYWSRTHHSNADVYDRLQEEDLKQAATVLATFVYNAAVANEKIPRKPAR